LRFLLLPPVIYSLETPLVSKEFISLIYLAVAHEEKDSLLELFSKMVVF
jgi:hypothetical protein